MNATFLDTSFLIAIIRTRDEHHPTAIRWKNELRGPFITTEYVLIEFLDASAPVSIRQRGLNAARVVRNDPNVEIAQASSHLLEEGLRLFEKHTDKEWGLNDCISFALMRRMRIQDALTSDRHFEQAGFGALLRVTEMM